MDFYVHLEGKTLKRCEAESIKTCPSTNVEHFSTWEEAGMALDANHYRNRLKGNALLEATLRHIKTADREELYALAESSQTAPEVLEALAGTPYYRVKMRVAANPKTDPATLRRLAFESSEPVRLALVRNPAVPVNILRGLSVAPEIRVRQAVAAHSKTPADVIVKLVRDNWRDVRKEAIINEVTPDDTLDRIMERDPSAENKLLARMAKLFRRK